MKLNSLTRWYLRGAVVYAILAALTPLIEVFSATTSGTSLGFLFLLVSQFLFLGGFGIKFLPSSLGGNPHVWSLRMALWSFWLFLGGSLVTATGYGLRMVDGTLVVEPGVVLGGGSVFLALGGILLLLNLWQTMQNRVS